MKKILAVVLGAILFCTGIFVLSACGNDQPEGGTQVSGYAPDGAPALALAQLMSEDMQFGGTVTYNVVAANTIQTYVTGNAPKADIAVLPVNAAAMLLGKGDTYQMLGAVTHGNLYVLSAKHTETLKADNLAQSLAGSKIGCLQLENFVGYALRAVLSNYGIAYEVRSDKNESNDTQSAYLYPVEGTEITPAADYDYMIAAEPAVTKKVNATASAAKPLTVVGDLQGLYGEQGYPQAVLVAKKSLIEENAKFIDDFTKAVDESAAWILDEGTSAKTIYDAVVGHFADKQMSPTFSESDLTKAVIGRCAVRFDAAQDCKARVTEFLSELSEAAGKTFSASDAFFYTGTVD